MPYQRFQRFDSAILLKLCIMYRRCARRSIQPPTPKVPGLSPLKLRFSFFFCKIDRFLKMLAGVLTLSQTTNFRLFQSERFAHYNFKLDENGRKFSRQVENTVGKGEIARYEQFLLFPQCFLKTCTADTYKPGLVLERFQSQSLTIFSFVFFLLFQEIYKSYSAHCQ